MWVDDDAADDVVARAADGNRQALEELTEVLMGEVEKGAHALAEEVAARRRAEQLAAVAMADARRSCAEALLLSVDAHAQHDERAQEARAGMRSLSERVEAVMGCLLALTGWTTGHAFCPDAVTFVHGPLADPARYTQRLGVPVHFNGDANMLAFDTANLALPLSQANPALYAHLQRLAMDELDALGSRSLGARIRHILTGHPDWGRDRVAFELDISPRHLVRRLAAEGESFKQLHDELRRALAERALRDNVRADAIAERLGFADERAFARAFKRWTGITPARFRAQQAPRTDALLPGR